MYGKQCKRRHATFLKISAKVNRLCYLAAYFGLIDIGNQILRTQCRFDNGRVGIQDTCILSMPTMCLWTQAQKWQRSPTSRPCFGPLISLTLAVGPAGSSAVGNDAVLGFASL